MRSRAEKESNCDFTDCLEVSGLLTEPDCRTGPLKKSDLRYGYRESPPGDKARHTKSDASLLDRPDAAAVGRRFSVIRFTMAFIGYSLQVHQCYRPQIEELKFSQ
jgi:D-alanyl-D-alanine dipeptidase